MWPYRIMLLIIAYSGVLIKIKMNCLPKLSTELPASSETISNYIFKKL